MANAVSIANAIVCLLSLISSFVFNGRNLVDYYLVRSGNVTDGHYCKNANAEPTNDDVYGVCSASAYRFQPELGKDNGEETCDRNVPTSFIVSRFVRAFSVTNDGMA